jgi:hypothetical protein
MATKKMRSLVIAFLMGFELTSKSRCTNGHFSSALAKVSAEIHFAGELVSADEKSDDHRAKR